MTQCSKCNSSRIMMINGKCSDCCTWRIKNKDGDGYVPYDLNIGGGDYIEFEYCLDCGQIQGTWPVPKHEIEEDKEDE